jgi:peptidoglycan biosynthesis protein MviN/MurJ (putative lipid II flippase)
MARIDRDDAEFAMRISISAIFVVVGFAVLLFGLGDQSSARMAAGWLGAVLGFWLR